MEITCSTAIAQPQNAFYRAWVQNGGTLTPNFAQPVVTVVNGSGETYIAGSSANAYNTQSMLLTKYSNVGTPVWSKTFNINTAGNTYPGSIALDPSGNVVVAGYTTNASNTDGILLKYSSSGKPSRFAGSSHSRALITIPTSLEAILMLSSVRYIMVNV